MMTFCREKIVSERPKLSHRNDLPSVFMNVSFPLEIWYIPRDRLRINDSVENQKMHIFRIS